LDHGVGNANLLGSEYDHIAKLCEFVPRPAGAHVHSAVWRDWRNADDLQPASQLFSGAALIDLETEREFQHDHHKKLRLNFESEFP
jgi:hypothetical protein